MSDLKGRRGKNINTNDFNPYDLEKPEEAQTVTDTEEEKTVVSVKFSKEGRAAVKEYCKGKGLKMGDFMELAALDYIKRHK